MGGGGSRGSNEPPLQVNMNNGGLKTQAANFQLLASRDWKTNFECFSSVLITLQENANSIGKFLWAQIKKNDAIAKFALQIRIVLL